MTDSKNTVLITGASTGIGRACALRFARNGYRVYAGVRSEHDFGELEKLRREGLPELRAVILDVTNDESVQRAAKIVLTETDSPLIVVNNAGIVKSGPLEFLTVAELHEQFEVNVVGVLRVTQAFVARMRERGGRIIHISSCMGRVAWPFSGAYSSSKFALEGLAEAWRHELAPFNIPVTLIEPGAVATPIWKKSGIEDGSASANISAVSDAVYGKRVRKLEGILRKSIRTADTPEYVATVVARVASCRRPPMRVPVGKGAKVQIALRGWLPFALWEKLVGRIV